MFEALEPLRNLEYTLTETMLTPQSLASSHLLMTATTAKCVISRHGKHSRLVFTEFDLLG